MEKKAVTIHWNNAPIACEEEMLDHKVLQGIPEVPENETTAGNYNKSKIMSKRIVDQNFNRDRKYKCSNEAQRFLTNSNSHVPNQRSRVAPSLIKNAGVIHSSRLRTAQDHSDIPYTAVILKRSFINPTCCDKIDSQKSMNRKSFFDRQSQIKEESRRLAGKSKKTTVEITKSMENERLAKKKMYKRPTSKGPDILEPSLNVCCNRSSKERHSQHFSTLYKRLYNSTFLSAEELTNRFNNTNMKNIRKITNWRSEVLKIFSKLTVLLLYLHFLLSYNLTFSKSHGLRKVFESCMVGDIRQ